MEINYADSRKRWGEYGTVEEIRHPVALVRGLPGAASGEIVILENSVLGQVTALKADYVEIVLFSNERITAGLEVARTGKQLSVAIGAELAGKVINPLGQVLLGGPMSGAVMEEREIDIAAPHINQRTNITKMLVTGTSVIDLFLTLGQGQREAILGDPTTGKNSFLLTTVQSHAKWGKVVYAAIGKPWSDIKRVYNFITQEVATENVTIVVTSAEDVISSIALTPFTAMTIAEYWRDQGEHVLVVLDDLSTHARFYREMGLLARKFPARESYPGDIFHLHARLLERAGNFIHPTAGESSITCLPVAETVRGDITGYISSNLISITDGHLLFDETIFSQGRRPAINIPLSVTRVGGQTRTPLMRALNRKLMALLARHASAQSFTHFGTELNESLKRLLEAGDRLLEFLSQPLFVAVPLPVQVTMGGMIWLGWLNGRGGKVGEWRECLAATYEKDQAVAQLLDSIYAAKDLETFATLLRTHKDKIFALCQPTTTSRVK